MAKPLYIFSCKLSGHKLIILSTGNKNISEHLGGNQPSNQRTENQHKTLFFVIKLENKTKTLKTLFLKRTYPLFKKNLPDDKASSAFTWHQPSEMEICIIYSEDSLASNIYQDP